ncbi:ACP S-malonyltransferase [Geodermatophilus sp. TF02-6]|uniref:ACP S-malonyltransferase n=1 Tax=Geodermatophilus sp. TF02-6 TaxID=2250575 RepID=UPI000DEA9F87|nr:ACP S-malonyltransferase [Geodermatophilus sp. TF02-6]RBY75099.1 ACP S-malonyltransferase [Geodermatophilus sp. TF02-6]
MTVAPPRGAAVVFPGQGTPRPGTADPWLSDAASREVLTEASDLVGRDVAAWWRDPLNLHDPAAAQLAVLVTGVAGFRSLAARGLAAVGVAGHSLGEYAALVAAGALEFGPVLELVHWRAELMALTPRPSCAGMAAVVGPDAGAVARSVVEDVAGGGVLVVATVNGPEQVVLSGGCAELDRARPAVEAAGLRWVRLHLAGAFHSPFMQPVAAHLQEALSDLAWSVPAIPVVPNVDGRPTRDPERLALCLREHLLAPVQWEATSRALAELGATAVLEVGATPTLGPLVRQVLPDLPVYLVPDPDSMDPLSPPEPALAGTSPA